MKFDDIKIYRMTHIENIPHILANGVTHCSSPNANPDYIPIGDQSIISTRKEKSVNVDNGDFLQVGEDILLGDFIPFYFGVKMPMLFVINKGGNGVEYPTPPEKIIYVVLSVKEISEVVEDFYFSDGHAVNRYTSFYDKSNINRLSEIIDWEAVGSHYWGGDENLDLKWKKEAEFLVKNDLSKELILGYICYNENAKQKLLDFGIDEKKIAKRSGAYY